MSEFEFVDALPTTAGFGGGGKKPDPIITAFAAALRERPGVWGKWPKPATRRTITTLQWAISKHEKQAPAAMRDGFEASQRGGVLYVRFIGGAA